MHNDALQLTAQSAGALRSATELGRYIPVAFDPFVIREYHIVDMVPKPQDVVVLLKLLSFDEGDFAYAPLSKALHMSASEVHAAVARAAKAQLYSPTSGRPMRQAPYVNRLSATRDYHQCGCTPMQPWKDCR